jgi:Zn-dependent peptidase ImmA (M78 family)
MSERDVLQEKINRLEILLGNLEALEAEYGVSAEVTALRETILGYLARHREELRDTPDPN